MICYFRLGLLRLNDYPTGLELTAGARNMRKATVKIRRNPLRQQTDHVRDI